MRFAFSLCHAAPLPTEGSDEAPATGARLAVRCRRHGRISHPGRVPDPGLHRTSGPLLSVSDAVQSDEQVAKEFTHAYPPSTFATQELEAKLIGKLVAEHERPTFESRSWQCMGDCGLQATSFASWHISALRSDPATCRTIAFPICAPNSKCHALAEQVWATTQQQIQAAEGVSTNEVESEDVD